MDGLKRHGSSSAPWRRAQTSWWGPVSALTAWEYFECHCCVTAWHQTVMDLITQLGTESM